MGWQFIDARIFGPFVWFDFCVMNWGASGVKVHYADFQS